MIFGVAMIVTLEARQDTEEDMDQILIEKATRMAFDQGYEPVNESPSISWIKLDGHDTAVIMGDARAGDYQVRVKIPVKDMP